MSTFGGRMGEYREVSLDRFDGENLGSTAYFLSHKHEDHMIGLASSHFMYRLQSNCHIKLYCSEVTRDLLLADERYTGLSKSLVVQELEVPCRIAVPDPETGKVKYHVTLTLIPAGHCPGSVMFLFEGPEGTALYTGDFRLSQGDIARVECLQSGTGMLVYKCRPVAWKSCGEYLKLERWNSWYKPIDSLYIDTTFCVPEAFYIPSREESVDAIIQAVESWITTSPQHVVFLNCRAFLGYEHLFTELAKHFSTKIHLSVEKLAQCAKVKSFPDFGTADGTQTQIHACRRPQGEHTGRTKCALPCGSKLPGAGDVGLHVKVFTVSTMWFTQQVGTDSLVVTPNPRRPRSVRACYSFHASYSEVRDVVLALKPRRARPNVIPMGHTLKQIQERLDNFLKLVPASTPPVSLSQPKLLGKQRSVRKRGASIKSSQSTDSDLIFDDSPQARKKPRLNSVNGPTSKDDKDMDQDKKPVENTGKTGHQEEDGDSEIHLRWEASQGSLQSSMGHGEEEEEAHSMLVCDAEAVSPDHSSYAGSQRSGSVLDLFTTDAELTPVKTPTKSVLTQQQQQQRQQAAVKLMNGHSEKHEEKEDGVKEEVEVLDPEVDAVREKFQPFGSGSYGSLVSYASDVSTSDSETNDEAERPAGAGAGADGKRRGSESGHPIIHSASPCNSSVLESSESPTKGATDRSVQELEEGEEDEEETQEYTRGRKRPAEEEDGEGEGEGSANQCQKLQAKKVPVQCTNDDDDDDDNDIIMLDSDNEEQEEEEQEENAQNRLSSNAEPSSPEEDVNQHQQQQQQQQQQPSTSQVQEVIDLTADDDDEEDDDDNDIVSLSVSRATRTKRMLPRPVDDGDGYHGDTESEMGDSDCGIMTDSDSSYAKAFLEKTKTRMRNGKSRRATTMNGYSSSESDSDVTLDEAGSPPAARYPIAGSKHFSRTRLNGFNSTLVNTEVIVLDEEEDEEEEDGGGVPEGGCQDRPAAEAEVVPPNVTVVDLGEQERREADNSTARLASAEDLVSGALEQASAANATSRLVSTIQRLRTIVTKSVLTAAPAGDATGEALKATARKSTSGPRSSPRKSVPLPVAITGKNGGCNDVHLVAKGRTVPDCASGPQDEVTHSTTTATRTTTTTTTTTSAISDSREETSPGNYTGGGGGGGGSGRTGAAGDPPPDGAVIQNGEVVSDCEEDVEEAGGGAGGGQPARRTDSGLEHRDCEAATSQRRRSEPQPQQLVDCSIR